VAVAVAKAASLAVGWNGGNGEQGTGNWELGTEAARSEKPQFPVPSSPFPHGMIGGGGA